MARVADDLVRRILFDGRAGLRLLNESAVQVDVWIAFAGKPADPVDLLLTPLDTTPAATLARVLHKALDGVPTKVPRHIAPLEATVAIRLGFEEFVSEVLPCTGLDLDAAFDDLRTLMLARRGGDMVAPLTARDLAAFIDVSRGRLSPEVRAALLVTLLLLARKLDAGLLIASNDQSSMPVMAGTAGDMPLPLERDLRPPLARVDPLIWRVALNRQVVPLSLSVSTIKADAAQRVFDIDCRNLTWAVIDSGIDGSHPAFRDHAAGNFATRVDNAYDFARMRALASFDTLADAGQRAAILAEIQGKLLIDANAAAALLARLQADAQEGRPYDWDALSRLLEVAPDRLDAVADDKPDGHGTHVAGVLAGDWREDGGEVFRGVCPNLRLLDLRVLGDTATDTEFAVIAALEFVRWMNGRNRFMSIHGVNLSIGLVHDRDNYACGRTPVCLACEATVASGVTVVAAAGNWGAQRFTTHDGDYAGYASISIADPGNAASVITVGSTHRERPHEYGVSFFSSRGPTADGRAKPDVVAPGERIDGPLPNLGFGRLDGTSMAAPHVSGVAALLMARHPEMVGDPARVKSVIISSATSLGRESYFQGAGLVDALRALQTV
ncbi:S8 family peptidase [Starkeya sp. ORNL1]|uniref:S8 family peptidase n=1 Tax=Starkeya sp. ORNL1 TaxID=2709380 RepID=UPI0014635B3D|nr:S8 family peptidase [Starkeya sp. ORNL1]QJP13587.1 S8 family peptidase [Starkeya sp. ORNL1]